MNNIKIYFERYYPLFVAVISTTLFSNFKSNLINSKQLESFCESQIFLIISTVILGILITHKSIILTMENNKGFKKLLTGQEITNRFFKYLNNTIKTCILIIIYNFVIMIYKDIPFCAEMQFFLFILLVSQFIRFIRVFDIVFEKSLVK